MENGLHEFLSDDPEMAELAAKHGVELRDLRKPPPGLSVPTGENLRVQAKIVLTVGSDCAIGKTVAIELDRAARARGLRSSSSPPVRPGSRSPAGASPSTRSWPTSWPAPRNGSSWRAHGVGKVLFVEGQGALVHPPTPA